MVEKERDGRDAGPVSTSGWKPISERLGFPVEGPYRPPEPDLDPGESSAADAKNGDVEAQPDEPARGGLKSP